MKILFLSHYFPPEVNAPASRTFEHCRQWTQDGHEVTVVTCAPNHPSGKVFEGYRNAPFQRETRNGIAIARVWSFVTPNEGFLKRTLNYISFMISSLLVLPALGKADVVITTSPQFFNGLAGIVASRIKRCPWVLEVRDLWPESIIAVGAIKNPFVIRCLQRLERLAYDRADAVVVVTDAFKRYMVSMGVPEEKIAVVKNGVDLSFFVKSKNAFAYKASLGLEGKFVAAYFGTHGMAHHLETILEAAEFLREYSDIAILMVGDGAERMRLLKIREEMRLSNVIMLQQQPKERMPHLWGSCDASLVLLRKSELFKTVIPSKIFESMGMECPIVLGVEGESAEIVNDAQAGICIPPEDARELASAILKLRNDRELGRMLGKNGRRYVANNFDRTVLARKMLERLSATVIRANRL
ncbi:MAG: glycosyltransferase family 4 protein [Prosthecobacter sp.]|nr:glycosyltransferase family 4 protein [Prosthecobacter sp.]